MKNKLITKIVDKFKQQGSKELVVIVNDSFSNHSGKFVYCELKKTETTSTVTFFTKGQNHTRETITESFLKTLLNHCYSTKMFEVSVDAEFTPEDAYVAVDSSSQILFIENGIYHIAKTAVQTDITGKAVQLASGDTITNANLIGLRECFKQHSYKIYTNFVFNKASNKLLNKLSKSNNFYSIQKAFVPVFIEYKYLYNPLLDKTNIIQQSDIYKMAIQKDRKVVINDSLSCYYLTHLEICRALHITKFIRFTPDFINNIVIGLLQPNDVYFPSINNKLMVTNQENLEHYKSQYSVLDFQDMLNDLALKLQSAQDDEEKAKIEAEAQILMSYREVNTLFTYCEQMLSKIKNYGANMLDTKFSVDDLYSILIQVRLR